MKNKSMWIKTHYGRIFVQAYGKEYCQKVLNFKHSLLNYLSYKTRQNIFSRYITRTVQQMNFYIIRHFNNTRLTSIKYEYLFWNVLHFNDGHFVIGSTIVKSLILICMSRTISHAWRLVLITQWNTTGRPLLENFVMFYHNLYKLALLNCCVTFFVNSLWFMQTISYLFTVSMYLFKRFWSVGVILNLAFACKIFMQSMYNKLYPSNPIKYL